MFKAIRKFCERFFTRRADDIQSKASKAINDALIFARVNWDIMHNHSTKKDVRIALNTLRKAVNRFNKAQELCVSAGFWREGDFCKHAIDTLTFEITLCWVALGR